MGLVGETMRASPDQVSCRSISTGTSTWQPFSASRRANCQSGFIPGARPISISGVWSASGSATTRATGAFGLDQQAFTEHAFEHRPAHGEDLVTVRLGDGRRIDHVAHIFQRRGGQAWIAVPMILRKRSRFGCTDFS